LIGTRLLTRDFFFANQPQHYERILLCGKAAQHGIFRQFFWPYQANGTGILGGQSAAVRRGARVLHRFFTRAVNSRFACGGRDHLPG